MNGLNAEPGCRQAWVTWLNFVRLKSNPPTSARIAPSRGSTDTNADSTSGNCAICQFFPSCSTRMIDERVVVLVLRGVGLQVEKTFRTPIALAPVVIEYALAHRLVRDFLIRRAQGRIDAEAARVNIFGVLLGERLTHHFRQVLRMH